jgi:hypothetical protein
LHGGSSLRTGDAICLQGAHRVFSAPLLSLRLPGSSRAIPICRQVQERDRASLAALDTCAYHISKQWNNKLPRAHRLSRSGSPRARPSRAGSTRTRPLYQTAPSRSRRLLFRSRLAFDDHARLDRVITLLRQLPGRVYRGARLPRVSVGRAEACPECKSRDDRQRGRSLLRSSASRRVGNRNMS